MTLPATMANRSGSALSPDNAREMAVATEEFPPRSNGDHSAIADIRIEYSEDGGPIATMPPPAGVATMAATALKSLAGKQPVLFLDKLGERLAFERAGRRLYEGLVSKHQAYGGFPGGPSVGELQHIADEELQHAEVVRLAIEELGGDPTAVTVSADVTAVASMGLCKVITDPRTNLVQSLEAILIAELADNDCWAALVELAGIAGQEEMATRFEEALSEEREHLDKVRTWLSAAQSRSGGVAPAKPAPQSKGERSAARRRSRSRHGSRPAGHRGAKKGAKPRKAVKGRKRGSR